MVDKIDSSTHSLAVPKMGAEANSIKGSSQSLESQIKEANDKAVKPPATKITEVAAEAATDKSDSLQSLDIIANELREAISALNAALEKSPTKALITRDEQLNRYIVRIADKTSGEIVREIPSEHFKIWRNLQELKGLIFDASL